MALTQVQLNAHLRTMVLDQLPLEKNKRETILFFLRACITHYRTPGADNQEAARTIGQFMYEKFIDRAATASDLHLLRKHASTEADETASGELG